MKQRLKLLAPYLAVGVFLCVFSNAWLAILAYHAQILWWSRHDAPKIRIPDRKAYLLLALPAMAAGPVLYFLLPYVTRTDLSAWLQQYHLSRVSLALMIPYFGVIHPVIEQIHWARLREETSVSHAMFAGYHLVVLYSLLTVPWLMACIFILMTASLVWQYAARHTGSLAVPVVSHILADLGIVIAVWLKT